MSATDPSLRDLPLPTASILLVDDYPANILALEAVLQPLGHTLVRANSGEEALKQVLKHELALIIMDVQMPGMDGFQTASLIKTRDRSRHIPIIFLTAISKDAAHVFEGYAHGAVDYLMKPYDPQILRSKVSVFVELWQRGQLLKDREAKLRELERERLERASTARYAMLIETMPHCVLALRASGEPWFCNSVWREYAGLDVTATRQRGWDFVHPDERTQAHDDWNEARAQQQPLQREVRLKRARDGEYRWHLVHVLPQLAADGKLDGWIVTALDVHHEKETREEVERISRAKDEFLATVSHELRNPLNAILGWTRMLRAGTLDPARAARALETIERNARMQASLVEDMLDVSRIITGKLMLKIDAVDLCAVVAAAFDTVRLAAEAKQIEVALELDDCAMPMPGDPDRLQQVVWNLLSNAIKFTRPRRARARAYAHRRRTGGADGAGRRSGHRPELPAVRVRALPAGRLDVDALARRARAGPRDRAPSRRAAWRHRQRVVGRRRERRDVHGAAAAARRRERGRGAPTGAGGRCGRSGGAGAGARRRGAARRD